MEPDGDPFSYTFLSSFLTSGVDSPGTLIVQIIGLFTLLLFSALVSGSEVAFFSIKGSDKLALETSGDAIDKRVLKLLEKPKHLLATILISNNFLNIAIIVLSTQLTDDFLQFGNKTLEFIFQVVVVTFLLVLFGEVSPKIYASYRNLKLARLMARPMETLSRFCYPISILLVKSSSFFERRIKQHRTELSKEELSHAIELTSDDKTSQEEKDILRGIINFGETTVKQIMKPRQEMIAYPETLDFKTLKEEINKHRFSRLPIYKETIDHIEGILHVKDLLPHLDQNNDFAWRSLIRPTFFVPEVKEIDKLLKEFKTKKMHLAVVVDEYGGTEGIVTLEDVLEEIVGEIHDEFDRNELVYSRLDDRTVVFDAKTSLSDVVKILNLKSEFFDPFKNQVESIGGLATELNEKVPLAGEELKWEGITLTIELADRKKVRRVKCTVAEEDLS